MIKFTGKDRTSRSYKDLKMVWLTEQSVFEKWKKEEKSLGSLEPVATSLTYLLSSGCLQWTIVIFTQMPMD